MADEINKAVFIYEHLDALILFAQQKNIDDHAKRGILRFFFILLDDLTKLAGTLKNDLLQQKQISQSDAKQVKEAIRVLSESYERQYDIIRDKFAAHGQPVDLADVIGWWNEIDITTLNVFYGDAVGIKQLLASAIPFKQIVDSAPLDLKTARRLRETSEVSVSSDRLALTKKDSVSLIAGHETQKKAQVITSLIDLIEIDLDLTVIVDNADTRYKCILFSIGWYLAVCDACSLIDNLYEDTQYDASLLTTWRKHGIEAWKLLEAAERQRDHAFEKQVREVRNKLAAHIDGSMAMADIFRLFAVLDLGKLHQYICLHIRAFDAACHSDIRLRPFLIRNTPLKGFDKVANTGHEPFDQ